MLELLDASADLVVGQLYFLDGPGCGACGHSFIMMLAGKEGTSPSTRAFLILLGLGCLDSAGYSVIGPVLPALVAKTHASPVVAGVVVASLPFAMVLGFLPAGAVVRRLGSRKTLLAALAVVGAGSAGFVASDGLVGYAISRFVMGIGSGGLWIGIAFGTLERWPGQEYVRMSRVFAGYSIGALLGPALGSLGGVRKPFVAYLALVVIAGVLVAWSPSPGHVRTFQADRRELGRPRFWVAAVGITFAYIGIGLIDGALPLHFSQHLSQAEIGGVYAGVAILVGVGAIGAGHTSPRLAMSAGVVLLTVGTEVVGATSNLAAWFPLLAIMGLGIGFSQTGSTGALLDAVPTERIVSAMVVWSQMSVVGYLIAPIAGGAIGQTLGYRALGLVPGATAVVLAGVVVYARNRER